MLLNSGVGEDSWEFLGLQGDSVNPKGNQSWIFIGRTDAETETPILWPLDEKNWLNGKDPDARKHWKWEEKGITDDEMVGWHRRLDGHEFKWASGVSDGQGSMLCCSLWYHEESFVNERMRRLYGITNSMDVSFSKLQEWQRIGNPWYASVHGVVRSQIWPRDWTDWFSICLSLKETCFKFLSINVILGPILNGPQNVKIFPSLYLLNKWTWVLALLIVL